MDWDLVRIGVVLRRLGRRSVPARRRGGRRARRRRRGAIDLAADVHDRLDHGLVRVALALLDLGAGGLLVQVLALDDRASIGLDRLRREHPCERLLARARTRLHGGGRGAVRPGREGGLVVRAGERLLVAHRGPWLLVPAFRLGSGWHVSSIPVYPPALLESNARVPPGDRMIMQECACSSSPRCSFPTSPPPAAATATPVRGGHNKGTFRHRRLTSV